MLWLFTNVGGLNRACALCVPFLVPGDVGVGLALTKSQKDFCVPRQLPRLPVLYLFTHNNCFLLQARAKDFGFGM